MWQKIYEILNEIGIRVNDVNWNNLNIQNITCTELLDDECTLNKKRGIYDILLLFSHPINSLLFKKHLTRKINQNLSSYLRG